MRAAHRWAFAVIALGLALAPRRSAAQAGLDILTGLVSKLNDVNALASHGTPMGPRDAGTHGVDVFGFEATFVIGQAGCLNVVDTARTIGRDNCALKKAKAGANQSNAVHCAELKSDQREDDARCKPAAPGKVTETVVKTVAGRETTEVHYAPQDPTDVLTEAMVQFELAIGFEKVSGFAGGANAHGVSLSGNVTQYPYAAVYADFRPERRVTPYLGARAGFAALDAFRATDAAGTSYAATGGDLVFGLSAGLGISVGSVSLLVEAGATHRNFRNVSWPAASPLTLPTTIGLSTYTIGIGGQFTIPKK